MIVGGLRMIVYAASKEMECVRYTTPRQKIVKKWQAWTKLKDGTFGYRPRQLTTYECDFQPVKILTATVSTRAASLLGE